MISIQELLTGLALVVLGGILTTVVTKYRARVTDLRYYVWHNFFGSTVQDPHFGSIEIKFGGTKVDSLYVSTIQLANDSTKDLTNLVINIACDADSLLLTGRVQVRGSLNELQFTEEFLKSAFDEKGAVKETAYTRRDYLVPVFNRGELVEAAFLVTNLRKVMPIITLACDHPGVRLKFAVAKQMFWGEPQDESALLGAAVALAATWPLIMIVASKTMAVVIAATLGLLALPLGVGVRKLFKLAARLLG